MKTTVSCYLDNWSCLAFLLPFTLYLWCLAPTITFYDSGEFVTAIHFLGSAHSPGYPLFLLYAKPFTWLPFGNVAFKVNLATAVSAALACLACYHLIVSLLKDIPFTDEVAFSDFSQRTAALSGAVLLAVSPRIWLQSNHDKPYPLLTAIVALILLFLLRWKEAVTVGEEQPAWWYASAFLMGLAGGAHQTIVLLIPGCLLFVVLTKPEVLLRVREWILTATLLVFGGLVQLYLPFRAVAETHQNWGDSRVLSRFLWHLLRRGYPEEPHLRDIPLLLKQLGAFSPSHEFGWVGLILLFVGIWSCWRIQRTFLVLVLTSLVSFWLMIVGYFNPQAESIFLTEEFYTPLYLMAAVLITLGLYSVVTWGAAAAQKPVQYGFVHKALLALLFLLIPSVQLAVHLPSQDQHNNFLAQDYAVNSLRPLPEDAVLFTWGDSGAFPLWYLQGVEHLREDCDLPHIPHLVFPWYQHELPRLSGAFGPQVQGDTTDMLFVKIAKRLQQKRPVLMDFSTRFSVDWGQRQPIQQGIVYWMIGSKNVLSDDADIWKQYVLSRLKPHGWHPDMDSEKALTIHAYCLMQSAENLARRGHVDDASHLLQLAGKIMPTWQESLRVMRKRYAIPEIKEQRP